MWSRGFSSTLLQCAKCFTQSERSTFILRRLYPPRLNKLGAPKPKKFRRRNYYYELVEDTDVQKKPPLELVLTQNVPGIGSRGDKIELNMYSAYRDVLLPRFGVYANAPEAQELIMKKDEQEFSSVNFKFVENFLSTRPLPIMISADVEWKLEPWHVKLALRKIGVLTKDECITIPNEIKGPNFDIENKDFLVQITMNKKEKIFVRCRIYHWSSSNPYLNKKVIDINSPSEPLFPDEKEKIDEILHRDLELRRKKLFKGHAGNQSVL